MIDLRTASLTDFVPASIVNDAEVQRMIAALDPSLQSLASDVIESIVLPRIDAVPERVLDAIGRTMGLTQLRAWQLVTSTKVDGKRRILRNILDLRKRAGTRYATRRIFDLMLLSATVTEWFEDASVPHTYKVQIDASEAGITLVELQQVPSLLRRFARASQRLRALTVSLSRTASVRIYPTISTGVHITLATAS